MDHSLVVLAQQAYIHLEAPSRSSRLYDTEARTVM